MKKRLILVCASLIFAMATAVSMEAFADKTTLQDPGTGGGALIICDGSTEGKVVLQCWKDKVVYYWSFPCELTGRQSDHCNTFHHGV